MTWILNTQDEKACRFTWLRVKAKEFYKGRGISWLAERLLPLQERIWYTKLVTLPFVHLDLSHTQQWTSGFHTWLYCVYISKGRCNGGSVCSSLIHSTNACHLHARPSRSNAGPQLSMRILKNLLLKCTEPFPTKKTHDSNEQTVTRCGTKKASNDDRITVAKYYYFD